MARYQRIMAVGCTHGHLIHPKLRKQVLAFRKAFNPQIRVDLGDLIDTAAFRAGATGGHDECEDPRPDANAAVEWLREYEPTHIAWGNHCWRLWKLANHPKQIISVAASTLRKQLTDEATKLYAKTVPYHIRDGWHVIGGYYWGHGYMVNIQAVRDHAEMLGGAVVMAHIHKPEMYVPRTINARPSFCAGTLMDPRNAHYAEFRRATLQWAPGIVYGEVSDTDARLHLAMGSAWSDQINVPPGVL